MGENIEMEEYMKLIFYPKYCAALMAVCALSFSPIAARADVGTISNSNNAYWASVGASTLNYKESVQPIPNSQRGELPSVAVGASYMGSSGLYVALDSSVSFGNDHYKGALMATPSVLHERTTKAVITTVDGKLGKGFVLGQSAMVTPYVDVGFRYWERTLSNQQKEDYQNFAILGGAMFQYSPMDRLVLTTYGAAGLTLSPQMRTSGVTYDLDSAGVYKLGGKIGYNLTQRLEFFTSLDFDYFRFVKSDVKSGIYEPSSFTSDTSVRVGLSYHIR
jgi:hypothetical protein